MEKNYGKASHKKSFCLVNCNKILKIIPKFM